MAAPKSALKVVFGSMTFGKAGVDQARVHDLKDCGAILDIFKSFGHVELDSARSYGGGSCEEYLGQLNLAGRGIVLDTKLTPPHKPADVRNGFEASMKALGTDKVDMWYLHAPDHNVPYEDTLREVNALHQEGRFRRFGISNFSAWETAQLCEIALRNGWKKPDVYQGVYNALHRGVEPELFPCLRHYGIAFYQYNPLAGGFLTDRYQREAGAEQHEAGSRFDPERRQGANYRQRYWNGVFFDALDVVRPVAKKLGMTTAEAALRWSMHHSKMQRQFGDAMIIGASSAKQLEDNLSNIDKGPLPDEMVQAFEDGWAITKAVNTPYFR